MRYALGEPALDHASGQTATARYPSWLRSWQLGVATPIGELVGAMDAQPAGRRMHRQHYDR